MPISTELGNHHEINQKDRYVAIHQRNDNNQTNFSLVISQYNELMNWMVTHKLVLVGGSFLFCFVGIQGYIWSKQQAIESHRWSNWQKGHTFEQLQSMPDEFFHKELLRDIKQRYPASRHDWATSFLAFLDALAQEEADIEAFEWAISLVQLTRAATIFSYNRELYGTCVKRREQLHFLRNRLINSFIK